MRVAAAAFLVLAVSAGCRNNDDNGGSWFDGFRVGAACGPNRTCPPGQKCDFEGFCRQPCTNPGRSCMAGSQCQCTQNHECDVDGLCRPNCNFSSMGGGGPTPMCGTASTGGPQCPNGGFCDQQYNICRSICVSSPCSGGLKCEDADSSVGSGCRLCYPAMRISTDGGVPDGGGTDGGQNCSGVRGGETCGPGGTCTNNCLMCVLGENLCRRRCTNPGPCRSTPCECSGDEVCDIDNYCRMACGSGGPSAACSGGRPNCPNGLSCDTSNNVCRQDCSRACPTGFGCAAGPGDTCPLCRPGAGGAKSYGAIAIADRQPSACGSDDAPGADIDAVELMEGSTSLGVGLRGSVFSMPGGKACGDSQCPSGYCRYSDPALAQGVAGPRDAQLQTGGDDRGYFSLNGGAVTLALGDIDGGGSPREIKSGMSIRVWEIDHRYRNDGWAPPSCLCTPERYWLFVLPNNGDLAGAVRLSPTAYDPANQMVCGPPNDEGCGSTVFLVP